MFRFFILLCLFGIQPIAFSQQDEENIRMIYNTVYTDSMVDSMPQFPGGEEDIWRLIMENFRVNSGIANEAGTIENVFVVTLIVDEDGNTTDIAFHQSYNSLVEKEMLRVLEMMPPWKPAVTDGLPVPCRVYFPVRYLIDNRELYITNSGVDLVVGNAKKSKGLKWALAGISIILFYVLISGAT